jgi:hypothetical protein
MGAEFNIQVKTDILLIESLNVDGLIYYYLT